MYITREISSFLNFRNYIKKKKLYYTLCPKGIFIFRYCILECFREIKIEYEHMSNFESYRR
ncbi:hypothetical protein LEP1GSC123_0192 [Leptospira borgpetersenii str. 200701203]|uniref:Uncharacterized protein n=1 Tax=Leptospira borgpetersenii str. 200701203 TaxID=1193007 RepID=M3FJF6_LEPBO|nr:hypothetical protein LEP1GSC123_0192 [Leptospira borgpetersenii str. 200701203]